MAADVVAAHHEMIDLTNEPDTPPTPRQLSLPSDDDIQFVGFGPPRARDTPQAHAHRLALPHPPRPPSARLENIYYRRPVSVIDVDSQEDDQLFDDDGANNGWDFYDMRPHPPRRPRTPVLGRRPRPPSPVPHLVPDHNNWRVFSPPAVNRPLQPRHPRRIYPAQPSPPPPVANARPPLPRIQAGGGLMTVRNRGSEGRPQGQAIARPAAGNGFTGRAARAIHYLFGFGPHGEELAPNDPNYGAGAAAWDDIQLGRDRAVLMAAERDLDQLGRWRVARLGPLEGEIRHVLPPKPTYNHTWTHGKATPRSGFTFDFDPSATSASAPIVIEDDHIVIDDEDHVPVASGSSAASASAPAIPVLVCAKCDNPLVLGSKEMWGLRCGHVVCGTCVEIMSRPEEGKGKGKEVDMKPIVIRDMKGKGKAKEEPVEATLDEDVKPHVSRSTRSSTFAPASQQRNLRSRTIKATQESVAAASSASTTVTTKPSPSNKRKRGTPKKPRIEREHEYSCPVEGCWKGHWSVQWWEPRADRPDGEFAWKQKEDLGAIPIFT